MFSYYKIKREICKYLEMMYANLKYINNFIDTLFSSP